MSVTIQDQSAPGAGKIKPYTPDRKLLIEFEKNERAYWSSVFTGKTVAGLEAYPVIRQQFGTVFAGGVPGPDILAYNRVLGIGLEEPVTGELLNQIRDFYKSGKISRIFMPVYPFIADSQLEEMLTSHGFQPYNYWSKLWRSLDDFEYIKIAGIEVRRVDAGSASIFGSVLSGAFGFSSMVGNIFSATFSNEGYRHYIVTKNGNPIAAGALYIRGIYASMAIAGTLPEYRGLGAQTALLNERLKDAVEAGCKYATTETGMDTPEKPIPSFRNMIRAGFHLAYLRPNYIMHTGV